MAATATAAERQRAAQIAQRFSGWHVWSRGKLPGSHPVRQPQDARQRRHVGEDVHR